MKNLLCFQCKLQVLKLVSAFLQIYKPVILLLMITALASCSKEPSVLTTPNEKEVLPLPVPNYSVSLNSAQIPSLLTLVSKNEEDIKVSISGPSLKEVYTDRELAINLNKEGVYIINYQVSNKTGTSEKNDTLVVFCTSSLPNFLQTNLDGVTVNIQKDIAFNLQNQADFRFLLSRILRIKAQVPDWFFQFVKNTKIWVDNSSVDGSAWYNASAEWLVENGYPREMAKGVQITNLRNYVDWTRKNQPEMLLHEMSHAYHHQVMVQGYNNPFIMSAYTTSMSSGKYNSVDYSLGGKQKAYATNNQIEFFAELTEAWFGKNDYYPFTKEELRIFDLPGYELMNKVWKLRYTGL